MDIVYWGSWPPEAVAEPKLAAELATEPAACGGCAVKKRSAKKAKGDGVPPAWTDAAAALAVSATRDPQKVVFGPQRGPRDVSAAPPQNTQCRCGSTTHKRTNHSSCPLNPKKTQRART